MGDPIDRMICDADEAWRIFKDDMQTQHTYLLGEMSCHVRALVQEIERLNAALAVKRETMAEMVDAARYLRRDASRIVELHEAEGG